MNHPKIEIATLPEKMLVQAQKEINEHPASRQAKIAELRSQLLKNNDVKGCMEDYFLLRFLRARKFKLDKAAELYGNYYAIRKAYVDIYKDLSPGAIAHVVESGVIALLDQRDANGRFIILMRVALWDPDKYPFTDLFRTNLIIVEELLMTEPSCQICGISVVIDLTDFSFKQASNVMGVKFAKRAAKFLQDTTPIRVRAVHIYNEPSVFTYIFTMLKPFLSFKNQRKVIMHGPALASLHQHVPASILPENANLGGSARAVPHEGYVDRLKELDWYFEMLNDFQVSNDLVNRVSSSPLHTSLSATGGLLTRRSSVKVLNSQQVARSLSSQNTHGFNPRGTRQQSNNKTMLLGQQKSRNNWIFASQDQHRDRATRSDSSSNDEAQPGDDIHTSAKNSFNAMRRNSSAFFDRLRELKLTIPNEKSSLSRRDDTETKPETESTNNTKTKFF